LLRPHRISRDDVAQAYPHDVTGNQVADWQLHPLAVSAHTGGGRKSLLERLNRVGCLVLLGEGH